MPMYAVRWADFTMSLIEAPDRNELFYKIDEISDPMLVTFQKIENPIYLNLKCKPKPVIIPKKDDEDKDEEEEKKEDLTAFMKLKNLMNDKEFNDVNVCIGGSVIPCHKSILASNDYFKCLLKSDLKEMKGDKLILSDVDVRVFEAVREFLYLCRLDWKEHGQNDVDFLYELLQYCHMIQLKDLQNEVEKKILQYMRQKGWDDRLVVSEMVDGINISQKLLMPKLHKELSEKLFRKIDREVKDDNEESKKRDFLQEVQKVDTNLADFFQERLSLQKKVELQSSTFSAVFNDIKPKSFLVNLKVEGEKIKELGMLDQIDFCPYHRIISKFIDIEKPSKIVLKRCCSAIQTLNSLGFSFTKKGRKFGTKPGLMEPSPTCFESKALQLAAMVGQIDLVKALVEVGADPLEQVYPNGETLIHVINDTIQSNNCEAGRIMANLDSKVPVRKIDSEKVQHVLDFLLERTGHSDVEDVQYINRDMEINPEYIKKVMGRAEMGNLSVPFTLDSCECESDCHLAEELAKLLHPRASDVVSNLDEMSYPDDDTQLRKEVEAAIKQDSQDASRSTHPSMDKFANHPDDDMRPRFNGQVLSIGSLRATLAQRAEYSDDDDDL